ncbi:delta-class carbonic anhydrase [Roseobacter sp. A03A-229]
MKSALTLALSVSAITAASSLSAATASDEDIAAQRAALAEATKDAGFGPQSPRDLSTLTGENDRVFATAPAHTEMNLCNIHFHENAEHRGGQFTTYAGNGDGKGAGTGFRYDGTLTEAELAPYENTVGSTKYGDLQPGDTIEVHYVHTTAQVQPGPTLGSCLSEAIANPQLRVEAQVFVLVNDDSALDFTQLTAHELIDGLHQAPAIPTDTGTPILYPGSTTGPSFNTAGSPLQVTWSVRPDVAKVSIRSVEAWLADNTFDETGAHGVRNLVTNPALLAPITQTGG